jgi:periplasmic copper chaperone A
MIAALSEENMANSPTANLFAATVALACSTVAAAAADYDVGSIHIAQPWSRATPKGAKAGAGYMTITNKGTTPDKVSCVSDDAARNARFTA